jgi:hypothetical protein
VHLSPWSHSVKGKIEVKLVFSVNFSDVDGNSTVYLSTKIQTTKACLTSHATGYFQSSIYHIILVR